jgi:hypothetical protein
MSGTWSRVVGSFWHAKFFSPRDLVCRAAIIAVIYAMVNVAGLREYTSILNGTAGSAEVSRGLAAFLGVGYVCAYLAFVLLVPVFLIAAGLLAAWEKWMRAPPTTGGERRAGDASG